MKQKHRLYWRLNLVSIFFIVLSFISVTLAWFAYSGLSNVSTDVDVKAWYITLEKNGEEISNDIVISLSEIYPGMETLDEVVKIKNLGDSDAKINYSIVSARILGDPKDNYVVNKSSVTSEYVEDLLSHDYPFHININLSKNYVLAKGDESKFEVSVSWPLDSDHDALDSFWGNEAYKFQQSEANRKGANENYQIRSSIQVVISVTAEQYMEEDDDASDTRFNLGDTVLFDVVDNKICTEISPTCITTFVADVNNKLSESTVTLIPSPKNIYLSGTWNNYNSLLSTITNEWTVETRALYVEDVLRIISSDVMKSLLIRENLSDGIIGNLRYGDRIDLELEKATSYNGHYTFINHTFNYLSSNICYWTNSKYNESSSFAIKRVDEEHTKVYGLANNTSCNIIPVILADKINL